MNLFIGLGTITVGINIILVVIFCASSIRLIKLGNVNFQLVLLLLSVILLLPVMVIENVLFIHLNFTPLDFDYTLLFMRIIFLLGVLGYLVYNLNLLSIIDFPTFPILVLSVLAGFAIGSMLTSTHLDLSNTNTPIYYDPIEGGIYFIVSLMIFNIIGLFVFIIALRGNGTETKKVSPIEKFAIFNFFISPLIIFLLRVLHLDILPFNFIFLNSELSFCLHLGLFLYHPLSFGYPTKFDLYSLSISDLSSQTVIGGYSHLGQVEQTKISGMRFIAVDGIIKSMLSTVNQKDLPRFEGNYGGLVFIIYHNYLAVCTIKGQGKKNHIFYC